MGILEHDGEHYGVGLHGKAETAALERRKLAVLAARSLGENEDERGRLQVVLDGFVDGLRSTAFLAVDTYTTDALHPKTKERDSQEVRFRNKAGLAFKREERHRDVRIGTMIAHDKHRASLHKDNPLIPVIRKRREKRERLNQDGFMLKTT